VRLIAVPAASLVSAPGGRDRDDREQDRLDDLDPFGMLLARARPVVVRERVRDFSRRDRLWHFENLARPRARWFIQTGRRDVVAPGAR
jgi:hypothetical protein